MTGNITQLLLKWSDGDQTALDQLMPLVYDELRQLARSYLRRRGNQHSMEPTALVNQAYLRLVNQGQVNWHCRAQFFGLAAKLMRNLLVDYVRERRAAKRGGGQYHLSLNHADQTTRQSEIDLIALDEALIVKPQPIEGIAIGDKPLSLSSQQVAQQENQWGALTEKFEMAGGSGKTWTQAEQEAGANSTRQLTQDDPGPQTIYRGAVKPGAPERFDLWPAMFNFSMAA